MTPAPALFHSLHRLSPLVAIIPALVLVAVLAPPAAASAIIGQPCADDSHCLPPRTCTQFLFSPCTPSSPCQCYAIIPCSTAADCAAGEQCTASVCIAEFDFLSPKPSSSSSNSSSSSSPPVPVSTSNPAPAPVKATGTGTGLTLEQCASDADCKRPRQCFASVDDTLASCSPSLHSFCACLGLQLCTTDTSCDSGEVCTKIPNTTINACVVESVAQQLSNTTSTTTADQTNTPGSPTTSDSNFLAAILGLPTNSQTSDSGSSQTSDSGSSQTSDSGSSQTNDPGSSTENPVRDEEPQPLDPNVCIAVHSLAQLPAHRLLYPRPIRARVLCDPHNTCATPGHILSVHDTPLMMKTYCDRYTTCTSAIMLVNSPVYRPALSLPSNTSGVRFTAFAARYQSRTEELFLSALVRLRL